MGFDYYAEQDLLEDPQPIVLHQLRGPNGKHPILMCVHAGAQNDGWINQSMLDADELDGLYGPAIAGEKISQAAADRRQLEGELRTRKRLAAHVVKDLVDAVRDDGTPATAADVEAFLIKIPRFVIVWLLNRVTNPLTFQRSPGPARPAADIAEK